MNQRNKRYNFLQSVKFFQDNWSKEKQFEFNNILHENASSYDQIIYDIDDSADKIYMIKSGKAIVETLIHINEENTYPIVSDIIAYNKQSPREWEKRHVKKQILYKVRTLLPGEIFGIEEFINLDNP